MSGRLQTNYKKEKSIEERLNTYPSFIAEWYYSLRASNREISSCEDYVRKAVRFLEFINKDINKVTPDKITRDKVTRYMISCQTKVKKGVRTKTSDSYKTTIWYVLKNLLHFLSVNGYIEKNYVEEIPKPKNNDIDRINNERILLTEYDFNKILTAVKNGAGGELSKARQNLYRERDIAIMLVFMYTGMRRTALSNINVSDINFEDSTLTVTDKGSKLQIYPLSNKVMSALNEWIEKRSSLIKEDTDALFISREGNRISSSAIYSLVSKYCEEALGKKISPHKLRSGFCSIMYDKTRDVEKVRRMVGHSNVSTTQRYIVTDNRERRESSMIMDELLSF